MLTDIECKRAKGADKPYRLTDFKGLHLYVQVNGHKFWRMRYEFRGKEKLLSFGPYPDVSLAEAREARDEAKKILREGRDPAVVRHQRKLAAGNPETSFEKVAREWHTLKTPGWVEKHAQDVLDSLEGDVFPSIGSIQMRDIAPADVLAVLRKIESRGARETAKRVRQRISAVFIYAVATGRANGDPAGLLKTVMAPQPRTRQPAITDLKEAKEMLAKIESTPSHPITKLANRLLALTVLRPGAFRGTPWSEFAGVEGTDEPVWRVPAARMKLKLEHKDDEARDFLIPLSRQAVEAVAAARKITGRGIYVFPNGRHPHKPMSENAISYLINRAGYHHRHVPHGWRSTFSTVMNEKHKADRHIIDLMLAHVPKDKVEGAYNRAAYLQRRRELAQEWADMLLDGLPSADDLLLLPRR
jgi:integrase